MFCAILTLFPEACRAYLEESILGIAQRKGQLRVELVNIRDFTTDRHRTADDRPFGGYHPRGLEENLGRASVHHPGQSPATERHRPLHRATGGSEKL